MVASQSITVTDGTYELEHAVTGLYLDSMSESVYNGVYDDALTLKDKPSRMGKVRALTMPDKSVLIEA